LKPTQIITLHGSVSQEILMLLLSLRMKQILKILTNCF